MDVAIYFKNGSVAYFQEVINFKSADNGVISFDYFGVASQKQKHAEFSANNIAGLSVSTD